MNTVINDQKSLCTTMTEKPRFEGEMEFFYSCAQSALIGSYLAEDVFGTDVARGYMRRHADDFQMTQEASEIDAQVTAVEYRDLKPFEVAPQHLPEPEPSVILGVMSQDQVETEFTARLAHFGL